MLVTGVKWSMAHYVATVPSTKSAEDAFTYMSDLRNFAEWDRGIKKVVQVKGDGPGLGAEKVAKILHCVMRPLSLKPLAPCWSKVATANSPQSIASLSFPQQLDATSSTTQS